MPETETTALLVVLLLGLVLQPLALHLKPARTSLSDLEISGMVAGLDGHQIGFVRYDDLLALPVLTTAVGRNISFREMHAPGTRITGLPLTTLKQAVGAQRAADLISARCADGYEAHFPADYVAAHEPLLVLKADGLKLGDWARRRNGYDPGPYMITNADFIPAFAIHAHQDRAQEPQELVRLEFTSRAKVYGAIAPRGRHAQGREERDGFVIARQNCLRCHGLTLADGTRVGGTKAQRSWQLLSRFATDDPKAFTAYIQNPKAVNPRATMPANPEYDGPTLAALTAYFRAYAGD